MGVCRLRICLDQQKQLRRSQKGKKRCSAASGSTTFRCLQQKQLPPGCLFHPILGPSPARGLGCSGQGCCGLHSTLPFSQGTDDFYMLNSGLLLSSSSYAPVFMENKIHGENLEFPCAARSILLSVANAEVL